MCAIAGIIGLKAEDSTIRRMLQTMRRRGPDAQGVYCSGDTALLHTRLAIIDPKGGRQPMSLSWAQERYTLVYNGELYNTEQLRQELLAAGHRFEGYSDTEVLLHCYAEYGEACLEKLNGIFAFAVWEENSRRLFLARDRIGVKPLFYLQQGQGFLFASEIKTILKYPAVRAQLDREGAAQLILLGPGRLPGSGVFRGIREVEPGWCGYYQDGKLSLKQYWKLRDREHRENFEDTVAHVRELVFDAIRRQMVSDVPIGTFLSGGLDSSIITAICAGEERKAGRQLRTFSVDYQNQERYFQASKFQPNSDHDYITIMQEAVGTEHHWTVLSPEALCGALEDATIARDLPGMADVDFSLLAFCGDIRREVRVALSGECADEIFGGYPWYRDPEVRGREGFPWAQNTLQRVSLLQPGIAGDGEAFVMDAYSQTCRESDILPGTSTLETRMKEMVNLNFRWFMQTLLDRKDRMSMYHGLEVRVPFCDYRIAEYLYGVPWEFKDYQGREKGLLREAVKDLLPTEILYRKKSPYPKTFDPRYTQLIAGRFREMQAQKAPVWDLVRKDRVEHLLASDSPWPWYGQLMRNPQIMAYFLQLDFWLRHYDVDICL
ncbi:MAG: asparagine synthase (glutamine-hydrolyzing) [Candidatus Faecousia sp.]|nr:asparagine synthase (glutamine-hydrolyzing) [Candidatus Faecousia sp.]